MTIEEDSIVAAVRQDLLDRSITGIAKYGVTLDREDLKLIDWLRHAYEEALDLANYLKRSIVEIEKRADKGADIVMRHTAAIAGEAEPMDQGGIDSVQRRLAEHKFPSFDRFTVEKLVSRIRSLQSRERELLEHNNTTLERARRAERGNRERR